MYRFVLISGVEDFAPSGLLLNTCTVTQIRDELRLK